MCHLLRLINFCIAIEDHIMNYSMLSAFSFTLTSDSYGRTCSPPSPPLSRDYRQQRPFYRRALPYTWEPTPGGGGQNKGNFSGVQSAARMEPKVGRTTWVIHCVFGLLRQQTRGSLETTVCSCVVLSVSLLVVVFNWGSIFIYILFQLQCLGKIHFGRDIFK